jgi:prepilin-type processing-associated H-X9-DG protein
MQDTAGFGNFAAFGSAHPNGFGASFCDGSIRVINYSIDPTLFSYLSNRADGHAINPTKY